MKPYRYVILNPTGNLTALVTEWGGPEEEPEITRRLMKESEQVAYLEPPSLPGSLARIRLMGGEFCGNAAMAAAGWLIRDRLEPGKEYTVPIEISGAEGVLFCRVRGMETGFEGTVEMPRVLGIRLQETEGLTLTAVQMEGIVHWIREGRIPLGKTEAEKLLKRLADSVPEEEAAGLLDRNPETGKMQPLVFVRASGTMVWETACGSGSAAVGALEAIRGGDGTVQTSVFQPGGVIRATATVKGGRILSVSISGVVRIGEETEAPNDLLSEILSGPGEGPGGGTVDAGGTPVLCDPHAEPPYRKPDHQSGAAVQAGDQLG